MRIKFLLPLAGLLLVGCATRTYTTVAPPPPGPSVADIQAMVQAHVSESVIVNQIQTSNTRYTLTVDQIIALKSAGAGDNVLNALIASANKPPVPTSTVVQESSYVGPAVYVDPYPWWGWGPYYHGYYRGGYYRGGGHWH